MNRIKGTGILLINSGKEILLFLRDDIPDIPFPGKWDVPGGHVEENELPEETIRREMIEEINLKLDEVAFFREYNWQDYDEFIYYAFIDLDADKLKFSEGQRAEYFSLYKIKNMDIAFHGKEIVNEFFEWYKKVNERILK